MAIHTLLYKVTKNNKVMMITMIMIVISINHNHSYIEDVFLWFAEFKHFPSVFILIQLNNSSNLVC